MKRITDEARSEVKSHRWDDGMDDAGNGSGGAQGSADVWIAPTKDAIGDSEVYNRESHTVTLECDATSDIVIDNMKFAEKQDILNVCRTVFIVDVTEGF